MNRTIRLLTTSAALFLLPGASGAPARREEAFWVKHAGAMRKVMQERDFSAHIDLADLRRTPHLYALGPAEGLDAEITVFDGRPAIAVVENGAVRVKRAFPKAAFLVYTRVDRWQPVAVPAAARAAAELEEFVARAAAAKGLDAARPFPFRLRATAERLAYHVVKAGDHFPFALAERPVEVLGFHSTSHHAVFTHHGTNIHLHFRTLDDRLSGHVDEIVLRPGATLYLPDPSP